LDVLVFCDRSPSQFNERTIPLALPRFGEPKASQRFAHASRSAQQPTQWMLLLPPLGSDRVDKTVKKENRTSAGRA
jgi:hypothetical protein